MEIITTISDVLVGAMGIKLVIDGVTSLGRIVKRGENNNGENINKELDNQFIGTSNEGEWMSFRNTH